jgi:hypothetical protein
MSAPSLGDGLKLKSAQGAATCWIESTQTASRLASTLGVPLASIFDLEEPDVADGERKEAIGSIVHDRSNRCQSVPPIVPHGMARLMI